MGKSGGAATAEAAAAAEEAAALLDAAAEAAEADDEACAANALARWSAAAPLPLDTGATGAGTICLHSPSSSPHSGASVARRVEVRAVLPWRHTST